MELGTTQIGFAAPFMQLQPERKAISLTKLYSVIYLWHLYQSFNSENYNDVLLDIRFIFYLEDKYDQSQYVHRCTA